MTAAIVRAQSCGNDTATIPDSALTVRLHEWPPLATWRTRGSGSGIAIALSRCNMRQPTDGSEAFSALEEEFFREGEAMSANEAVEHVTEREVLVEAPQRSGWSRWFARTPRAATAEG